MKQNKITIIGRKNPICKYCELSKEKLDTNNIPYEFLDINENEGARQQLNILGLKTVPHIFVDGKYLGDSTVVDELISSILKPSNNRMVQKRDGALVPFNATKINEMAEWATHDSSVTDWSSIVMSAMHKVTSGTVKTSQIQEALIQTCLDKETPSYNKVAGRLLLGDLRKSSVASLDFVDFYHTMVEDGYWRDMGYDDIDLQYLSVYIDHNKDLSYGYPTFRQLIDKYMLKDSSGVLLELPQYLYMGIAMSMFENDPLEDVIMYYQKASDQKINIPTPVMTTQRTPSNVGVSCIITTAGDSLQGITTSEHIAFMATASSAGIGFEYDVRSVGDSVRDNYATASGKLPHYKVLDKVVKAVKQNARGGSATVTFNVLDPEIETLLKLKLPRTPEERRIDLLDYTLCLNNDFLRRAARKEKWCLVSKVVNPALHDAFYNKRENFSYLMDKAIASGEGGIVNAFDVMVMFITARNETGRVYRYNIDNINNHTPFNKTVRLSNLCLEVALPTEPYKHITELYQAYAYDKNGLTAQCFLSAIDVARINDDTDYEDTTYIVLKALDNLINTMDYPFPQFESSAKQFRSVGVGITNLAYKLAKEGTGFKDVNLIHDIAERHYYYLLKASTRLARERGQFFLIDKTKWVDGWTPLQTYNRNVDTLVDTCKYNWDSLSESVLENGVRFSTLVAHMPCESSSVVSCATNSVYPIRDKKIVKDSRSGKIQIFAPECDKLNYDIAWDMDHKTLTNSYAILQKFNDQTTSADTYVDFTKRSKIPLSESVMNMLYDNKMGLKTLYYQNNKTGRGVVEKKESCESCTM